MADNHDQLFMSLKVLSGEGIIKEIAVREPGAFTASITDADLFANRICHILAERGVPLLRLDSGDVSLEDIFMEVIQ
jgi:hypothetical protein